MAVILGSVCALLSTLFELLSNAVRLSDSDFVLILGLGSESCLRGAPKMLAPSLVSWALRSESCVRLMPRILALSLMSWALVPGWSFTKPFFSSSSRSIREGREASGTKRRSEASRLDENMDLRRGEWRRSRFLARTPGDEPQGGKPGDPTLVSWTLVPPCWGSPRQLPRAHLQM